MSLSSRSLAVAAALLGGVSAQAIPIPVANFSFESQAAPQVNPFASPFVDSWQKMPEPGYWAAIEEMFEIPWFGTAGVFYDINPYLNHNGIQGGYILGFPGVTLFQSNVGANFEVGQAYTMTVGVYAKSSLAPNSTLELALYWQNGATEVVAGSTTVTYTAGAFPQGAPWNLIDFQVNVPTVQAGDAWAGQPIGIYLRATNPPELITGGNWDFDNVRLEAVPEPSSLALISVGACALWARRKQIARRL